MNPGRLRTFNVGNTTSIGDVLENPEQYEGVEIRLTGTVIESFSIMGNGAYQIDDGTGTIWVLSEKGVPAKGAEGVSTTGILSRELDLEEFGIPIRIQSGPVLRASAFEVR